VFDFTKVDLIIWNFQDLVIITWFQGKKKVWHIVGERQEKNDSLFVIHTLNIWL
jgi:hypothetical protein